MGEALRQAETEGLPWNIDETKPTAKHIPKGPKLRRIDPHAIAAIRLLILTGARLREILHAKWDYVDWDHGVINLPDSKTGTKSIYLSAVALAVLTSISRVAKNPYIIPGEKRRKKDGKAQPEPSHRADLKRPWEAIARAACFLERVPTGDGAGKGVRRRHKHRMVERSTVRIYDLRHSFASMGAGSSLGLPIIGKLLGHSQPATTARYSHLDADPLRRAANVIGDQITAAMDGKTAKIIPLQPKREVGPIMDGEHVQRASS